MLNISLSVKKKRREERERERVQQPNFFGFLQIMSSKIKMHEEINCDKSYVFLSAIMSRKVSAIAWQIFLDELRVYTLFNHFGVPIKTC